MLYLNRQRVRHQRAWDFKDGLDLAGRGIPTLEVCRDVTDSPEEGEELCHRESSRKQDANFRSSRLANYRLW